MEEWQTIGGPDGNILNAFYRAPERYAYTFQNYVFLTRCNQVQPGGLQAASMPHLTIIHQTSLQRPGALSGIRRHSHLAVGSSGSTNTSRGKPHCSVQDAAFPTHTSPRSLFAGDFTSHRPMHAALSACRACHDCLAALSNHAAVNVRNATLRSLLTVHELNGTSHYGWRGG